MPKKYKFSLESVLSYRQILEDKKEKEFSEALRELQVENKKLEKIKSDISNAFSTLRKCGQNVYTSAQFMAYQKYIRALQSKQHNQMKQIEKAKLKVNQKRAELIEASKEKKVLEHLDNVRKENYYHELEEQDKKFLDEIAITRFSFNNQPDFGGI
ncbi:MAG: flagellar export protein FliJ [Candidatus Auribacterota bacterium]|jgi:flagellar FliJ protein|nr:flagellar export protein FliJ [Candidatus Auribacterota bacterium]